VKLLQKMQHGAPAVVLLGSGLQALREGVHGLGFALALFEIATSVLLIGSVIPELGRARRKANPAQAPPLHHHHGVDWIDVFTAAVLAAEVWEHHHVTGHIKRPTVLLALSLLVIGLLHGKIIRRAEKRFTLRVEDEGLYVGGKPLRAMRAKWSEIASIDVGERFGTIRLKNGRQKTLDLPDLEGSNHVRAALATAQQRLLPGAG
jgi:hypothetical protein